MPHKTNQLRIIAGQWRSRVIKFPEVLDIRPTPDRVRETLFNWLQNHIEGAECLDLFAGSGALGFEALSRGAKHVTFIDKDPRVISHLETQAQLFETEQLECACIDTTTWLSKSAINKYNVVFLDPPFTQSALAENCLKMLLQSNWLAPEALIYIEQPSSLQVLDLPSELSLLRHKRAGDVHYGLLEYTCG